MKHVVLLLVAVLLQAMPVHNLVASENPPPVIDEIVVTGAQKNLRVTPAPGVQAYQFYSAPSVAGPFIANTNFVLTPYVTGYSTNATTNGPVTITNYAYEWRNTNFVGNSGFFTMSATPLSSNTVALVTVLNRLAYGPTPDDLVTYSNNPQAYIDEQLNMNGIPETLDTYTVEVTNAIPSNPLTNWTQTSMVGTLSAVTLYLFTTAPGDIYLDDFELNPHIYTNFTVTNIVSGTNQIVTNSAFSHIETTNMLSNGNFDSGSLGLWATAGGHAGTTVEAGAGRFGSGALHVVSTTGATNAGSSYIRQVINPSGFATTNRCTLSYWYLPSTNSNKLRVQLGSSGLNSTPGGIPATPEWVYVTATGKAGTSGRIYFFMSGAGTCYLDDIKLVLGTVPESGANLIGNGDFETGSTNSWVFPTRYVTNSLVSGDIAHSGNYSLKLVGTSGGSAGTSSSLYQNISVANGQTYTVSFWYRPTTLGVKLNGELSTTGVTAGSELRATPDITVEGNYRRLLAAGAGLDDYRAWFGSHAVNSKRQLFEVLSQFWENHFVTQHTKSRDYIDNSGYSNTEAGILATDWEWREMSKWRNAMLNPNCTFYDLLRISAESPAQIVFLDTVNSKGNGNNIANENYARELLELYAFGVDNGYDQNDIVVMSRAWTGWSVEFVDTANAGNPFATVSSTLNPGINITSKTNTIGTWAFNFKSGSYGTNRAPIFPGSTVPARFGPPWAGTPYQLTLPQRSGTNGIQDGYDVIAHMANQPFTQEYISVKLCRLFVHDEFPNPNTLAGSPGYEFYDYTDPNRSAEAELVHQCMLAWDNSSPKGNLRSVLSVIFNSDLFRSQSGNAQKVKTPFEFVASTVRALRASTNGGAGLTATTDGYSFTTPLSRMGGMNLFDRDAPDGYAENGANWVSAGTLVERIRYIQAFLLNTNTVTDAGNNKCDPVALFKAKVTSPSWGNAGAVTDYFLGILYPAEGAANLKLYRDAGVNFLNTGNDGITFSPFSSGISDYDTRVRGLVSMLMTLQRFQEQ